MIKEAGQQSAYLRAMAAGLQRAGEHLAALEALIELGDHVAHPAPMQAHGHVSSMSHHELQPTSAVLYARSDAWLRGQLADLRTTCTPAELAEVDRRITDHLNKAVKSKDARGAAATAEHAG